jgi:ATP-dependent RNA helicase DHX33
MNLGLHAPAVPQYLLESCIAQDGMIVVTQPHPLCAVLLATQVAAEQGVPIGGYVGFAVPTHTSYSQQTRIKYVTDEILVRELLSDKLLSQYTIIVVDGTQQRSLYTDLLLALLKPIQKIRNGGTTDKSSWPLKVVILSSTLDVQRLHMLYNELVHLISRTSVPSRFAFSSAVLHVPGQKHPVKTVHTLKTQSDYIGAACRTFFQIHTERPPGDVLIFLPSQSPLIFMYFVLQVGACRSTRYQACGE